MGYLSNRQGNLKIPNSGVYYDESERKVVFYLLLTISISFIASSFICWHFESMINDYEHGDREYVIKVNKIP